MWDIGKASRRPRRFARATGGGFPRLSGGVARGLRCSASPRHTLLAENLGKPSLWANIKDLWYQLRPVTSTTLPVDLRDLSNPSAAPASARSSWCETWGLSLPAAYHANSWA